MKKNIPLINKVMTPLPHTIGADIPLHTAQEMMREFRIRHLPVQKGGRLVGILTDRDVKLVAALPGGADFLVEDAMTPDPYTVSPDTPVDLVAATMGEHRYGCALIEESKGKVAGIFTANDALKLLAEVYRAQNQGGRE